MKCKGKLFLFFSVFCIIMALTACSTKDSDQDYADSFDADYLMTDYADQLLRDGADTLTGTVEITGTEKNYTVAVTEKKVVANENYENGYYIADRNVTGSYPLGSDLGILAMDGDEFRICSTEEFIKDYSGDSDSLYSIYLIDGVVELIQPLDPQTVIDSSR